MNDFTDEPALVSICCTTYNQESTIGQAIASFLAQQTAFRVEILIGEDASSDNTQAIVARYAAAWPDRVKLIAQPVNQGARKNLASLISRAGGRYIALCEGDDYWLDPTKLQRQVDFLEHHPDHVLCFHAVRMVNARGRSLGLGIRPFRGDRSCDATEIVRLAGIGIPTPAKVFRREAADPLPDWYHAAHVGDMARDLHLVTRGRFRYIDRPMAAYRTGLSGSWTRRLYSGPDILAKKQAMLRGDLALFAAYDSYTKQRYHEPIAARCTAISLTSQLLGPAALRARLRIWRELSSAMGRRAAARQIVQTLILIIYAGWQRLSADKRQRAAKHKP
jgi:glycosyltransferase involved in cell wall biosynthesis